MLFAPNVPAFELPALVCDNGGQSDRSLLKLGTIQISQGNIVGIALEMALGGVHKNGNIHHAHTGSTVFACSFVSGVVLCSLLHYCGCSSFLGGLGFCIRRYRQTNCQGNSRNQRKQTRKPARLLHNFTPFPKLYPKRKGTDCCCLCAQNSNKDFTPRPASGLEAVGPD